jgi:hypothetical protein
MAVSFAYKIAGPPAALSVANTQHAAVAVTVNPTDAAAGLALFWNTGATAIYVNVYPLSQTGTAQSAGTMVFPTDGTPGTLNGFVLPPTMPEPLPVVVPTTNGGFSVNAIGSAAGPSIMYVWPVTLQS